MKDQYSMPSKAIYPGSFDPVTYGHLDLIKRGVKIFDHVIVAVAEHTSKASLFSTAERVEMMKRVTRGIKGVSVVSFGGLIVNFARKNKVPVLIRGLRMISDFEYELQMALTNRRLDNHIETVFLMPSEGYSFLSSTLIKEAAVLGADVSTFVPDFVAQKLSQRVKANR